jgi:hypothetical protein
MPPDQHASVQHAMFGDCFSGWNKRGSTAEHGTPRGSSWTSRACTHDQLLHQPQLCKLGLLLGPFHQLLTSEHTVGGAC